MKISSRFFDVYISRAVAGVAAKKEVSVGSKVFKKAVDRNRLKRRIREVLRLYCDIKDRNIRIVALKDSSLLKFIEIKEDLSNIFKKL